MSADRWDCTSVDCVNGGQCLTLWSFYASLCLELNMTRNMMVVIVLPLLVVILQQILIALPLLAFRVTKMISPIHGSYPVPGMICCWRPKYR